MSIDRLQEKIRKLKNPFLPELCPEGAGWEQSLSALLEGMKGKVPGVRFCFSGFAILGPQALEVMAGLMLRARELGLYVVLDCPELLSVSAAQVAAQALLGDTSPYPCDGLVISPWLGSDVWKAFLPPCKASDKDVFVAVRTGNKSASELQDLVAGARMVHVAAADHVNRSTQDTMGKCGYSRIGVLAAASSQESLKTIRTKYPRLFILADGLDYSGASIKACAAAFDKLGHGAAIIGGKELRGEDWEANLERMKKNLFSYVKIL